MSGSAYQPMSTGSGYPTAPASYFPLSALPGYPFIPLGQTDLSQPYPSNNSLSMEQANLATAVSGDIHSSPQYAPAGFTNGRPQSEPYSRKRSFSEDPGAEAHDSPLYEFGLLPDMPCSLASPENYVQPTFPFHYQQPLIKPPQYYGVPSQEHTRPVTVPLSHSGSDPQFQHHHHHLPDRSPSIKRLRYHDETPLLPEFSVVGQDGMPNPAPKPKTAKLKFNREDDALLVQLKETKNLTWKQIADFFPGRSAGTLQVRYCTKLKAKTTLWDDDMVHRLRNAISDYDNDRWRAISAKVGSGFSAKACQTKAEELEVEELVADGAMYEESEDDQQTSSEA